MPAMLRFLGLTCAVSLCLGSYADDTNSPAPALVELESLLQDLGADPATAEAALQHLRQRQAAETQRLKALQTAIDLIETLLPQDDVTETPAERPTRTPRDDSEMQVTDADRSFWSFRPLANPAPPPVNDAAWVRTSVDNFVLAKIQAAGLAPNSEAEERVLIRRAYFDLIGLPPAPEAVDAFMMGDEPDAYDKLIDDLLASPHYGERWGRHWLDVARYADSAGYEFDIERPTAYRYRDFVIKALNDDMPYDQFVRWQIAGDEYDADNPMAVAATGFCTAGPAVNNQELELNRYNELDDMVSTTASAFLALTLACARCHDHKYDPIPARDYYRMLAAFTSSERTEALLAPKAERDAYRQAKRDWEKRRDEALVPVNEFLARHSQPIRAEKVRALEIPDHDKQILLSDAEEDKDRRRELEKILSRELQVSRAEVQERLNEEQRAERAELDKALGAAAGKAPKSPPTVHALTDKGPKPAESFLLARGNPDMKQEPVTLGFLSILPGNDAPDVQPALYKPEDAETTYQRTALAEWLTDVDNGAGRLLARVIVNRLWHHHFGRGIVDTPNDFGKQGGRPTHPELLDYLAQELIANGWRLKPIHKLIMTSAAYRQGTAWNAERASADPDNRLWWRREPVRLEAEIVRDATLAVSGCFNDEMFGPGIFPHMHPDAIATGSTDKWPKNVVDGPETWRRSIYIFQRRSARMPMMEVFDAPDMTQSCARRNTTTIPSQALAMMNSLFVRDQAKHFAARLREETHGDAHIDRAFRLAFGRPATDDEIARAEDFLAAQTADYGGGAFAENAALVDFCQVLLQANEFLYVE